MRIMQKKLEHSLIGYNPHIFRKKIMEMNSEYMNQLNFYNNKHRELLKENSELKQYIYLKNDEKTNLIKKFIDKKNQSKDFNATDILNVDNSIIDSFNRGGITIDIPDSLFGLRKRSAIRFANRLITRYYKQLNEMKDLILATEKEQNTLFKAINSSIAKNNLSVHQVSNIENVKESGSFQYNDGLLTEDFSYWGNDLSKISSQDDESIDYMTIATNDDVYEAINDTSKLNNKKPEFNLADELINLGNELNNHRQEVIKIQEYQEPIKMNTDQAKNINDKRYISPIQEAYSQQNTVTKELNTDSLPGNAFKLDLENVKNHYIIGKICGEDICDGLGEIIISKGATISSEIIERIEKEGKMIDLILKMTLPEIES